MRNCSICGYFDENQIVSKCPNCGAKMEYTIEEVISFILSCHGGFDLYKDPRRILAYVSDYAPYLEEERKLLTYCVDSEIFQKFLYANEASKDEQKKCIINCLSDLVNNYYIDWSFAKEVTCWVYKPLGWDRLFIDDYHADFEKNRSEDLVMITLDFNGQMLDYTGQIDEAGVPNGFGRMKYPNGQIWEGKFKNDDGTAELTKVTKVLFPSGASLTFFNGGNEGELTGYGRLIADTGAVYEGEIVKGKLEGNGHLLKTSGDYEDGIFSDNVFVKGKIKHTYEQSSYEGDFDTIKGKNGTGILSFKNGDYYEGIFINNKFSDGKVRRTEDEGVYEGYMKDGLYSGNGKYTFFDNGDYYEGVFEDGKLVSGKHKLTFENGVVYEGAYEKGERTGYGVQKYPNGDVFEGNFVDGCMREGKLSFSTGEYLDGKFVDGELIEGNENLIFENGDRYIGEIKDYEINGEGQYYFENGEYEKGTFKNGDLVNGIKYEIYDNGSTIVEEYLDGVFTGNVEYSINANMVFKGTLNDGKPWNGVITVITENESREFYYEDGRMMDVQKVFIDNGGYYIGTLNDDGLLTGKLYDKDDNVVAEYIDGKIKI